MTRRRWVLLSIGGVAALLLIGRVVAGWYVDYRWYEAMGATDIWRARAAGLTMLRGAAFVLATAVVFVNLFAVRHSVLSVVFPRRVGNIEIREEVSPRLLVGVVLTLSVAMGAVLAMSHDDWTQLELVRHGTIFRESDPHFQRDLSFWLYWLPLEMNVHVWALVMMVAVTLIVVFLYALTPSLRWESGRLRLSGYVRRHFFSLGAVFLLLLAWSYRIEAYRLLLDGSGPGGAFIALDHRVGVPSYLLLGLATVVAAMLLAWAGWAGQLRVAIATVAGVLVLSLALRQFVPPITTRLLTPTESEAQNRPYLSTRGAYTRRAFDLDRVGVPDARELTNPTPADAMSGASMWDPQAIARVLTTTADASTGGKGVSGLGWAASGGRLLALSVTQPIGPEAASIMTPWRTLSFATDRTNEGGGLVLAATEGDAASRVPASLVSDSVFGYAIVVDSSGAIAGPEFSRWGVRLAHAWALQNPSLLQQPLASQHTRAILVRNLRARVRRLFPLFLQDSRTVPAVVGDSLVWLIHLYTGSAHYPLSETLDTPAGDANYFRHAAVCVVNAHTGRAYAIPDRDPDPIARSWMQRFPRLFVPSASVSDEVAQRIPPPGDVALVQARMLARYGRRGDVAPPSHLIGQHGGDTLFAFPAYTPFADVRSQRLGVSYAILDASDRLRGAYLALGGTEFRPLFVELDSLGPRWTTVLERLRRATAGNEAPTRVGETPLLRGPARVVPMGSSLAVLQTTYAWPATASPSVHAVAVLRGDSVGVGRSSRLAVGLTEPEEPDQALTPEAFRARATTLYDDMRRATARGDWGGFGRALDALGRLLRRTAPPR